MIENLKNSLEYTANVIANTPVKEHNGVRYQIFKDFFDENALSYLEKVDDEKVKLERLPQQMKENRRLVNYQEDASKSLQLFFHSGKIIESLKKQFSCNSLWPKTTDMWFDYEGYQIVPHIDEGYQIQLQIYLNNESHPPTAFFEQTESGFAVFDQAEYRSNYGYCLFNSGPSWHGMTGPVISGKRKSIFARFQ